MQPDQRPLAEVVIRTGTEHMTIVEAHPYHQPVGRTDHKGAGTYVQAYSAACPVCRAERSRHHHRDGDR